MPFLPVGPFSNCIPCVRTGFEPTLSSPQPVVLETFHSLDHVGVPGRPWDLTNFRSEGISVGNNGFIQ